jgi:DNA replication protein DnaC
MNSPSDETKNPNPNLREQLERIGLATVAAQLDDMLAHAARLRWSPRQLLEHLAQIEVAERAHRSLERRLRAAEIKKFKPMADFEWSWPAHIERDVIERALTLDFLAEARNLVLVGANGLGKTMIAQNICHAAVLAGHSALFRTASKLLTELHRQTPEGRRRKLRSYANVALLCIDEVGYLSFDDKSADLLYEVINQRYEQKSLIITTNLLCGAPHNKFNAESIFMRTPRTMDAARCYFGVFLLRIIGAAFSRAISLSVALKRPVRSFGAITDSKASSFTLGSARV